MLARASKFFNPDEYEFLVHGFFEELQDTTTNKVYGFRVVEGDPDRPLGSPGRIQKTFTTNVTLRKGPKEIVLKASKAKPVTVWAMLQPLCGNIKPKQP